MRPLLAVAFAALALSACADLSTISDPDGPIQAPVAPVPLS